MHETVKPKRRYRAGLVRGFSWKTRKLLIDRVRAYCQSTGEYQNDVIEAALDEYLTRKGY